MQSHLLRSVVAIAIGLLVGSPSFGQDRKQEEIKRTDERIQKGDYHTGRDGHEYERYLGPEFARKKRELTENQRWLDAGAGQGKAVLDHAYNADGASVVGISVEDRRLPLLDRMIRERGADRVNYLAGKKLEQYDKSELGEFDLISDVYGAFSYAQQLDDVVEKVGELLKVGGSYYTLSQNQTKSMDRATGQWNSYYALSIIDRSGKKYLSIADWLNQGTCIRARQSSENLDRQVHFQRIIVEKTCEFFRVPELELTAWLDGGPPVRVYQIRAISDANAKHDSDGGAGFWSGSGLDANERLSHKSSATQRSSVTGY
jgi:hypothetical protein